MLKVIFSGASRTVTGSLYYFSYQPETGKHINFCVDGGMFQIGRKVNLYRINSFLLFDPKSVDFILLTHGHLDHCGRLPYLVKMGFGGKIYATPATKEIASIVMNDAYKHQQTGEMSEDSEWFEEDFLDSFGVGQMYQDILEEVTKAQEGAEKLKVKHEFLDKLPDNFAKIYNLMEKQNGKLVLYEKKDVDQTTSRFRTYEYRQPFRPHPNLEVEFVDAGHIFGSSYILLTEISTGRRIVFSGDIGNPGKPIIQDPHLLGAQNDLTHVFLESTYGDRLHPKKADPKEQLRKVIKQTLRKKGKVLIPSFSVERSQELVYLIVELIRENRLPPLPIYLDSPMAAEVTQVVLKYPGLYDEEMQERLRSGQNPLKNKHFQVLETQEESKLLNNQRQSAIIIAGSGMLNGGRMLKHLRFNIEDERHTIVFTGFQAPGTLGRAIVDGDKEVEIERRLYEVKAEIAKIEGFSGHGDQSMLKKWLVHLLPQQSKKPPTVFLVHGEESGAMGLKKEIESSLPGRVQTYWPEFGQEMVLWE